MVWTPLEPAWLNLSANGTRGILRQQAGSPQMQAAGCMPQGWSSPQGGFKRLEMGMDRNPPQAGQGQCPWQEKLLKVDSQRWEGRCAGEALDQGEGEKVAGPLQQPWPRACQQGCGTRSAGSVAWGGGPCLLSAHLRPLLQSKVQLRASPLQWMSGAWSKSGQGLSAPRGQSVWWESQRWRGLWPGMGLGHLGQSAAAAWVRRRMKGLGFPGRHTRTGHGDMALERGHCSKAERAHLVPRTGPDLGRSLAEAVESPSWARVCCCKPGCDMAALPGDLQRSLLT